MPDTLEVHLGRDGPHSIEVDPPSLDAAGSFEVVLRNHGSAMHVHLRLDPDLRRVATVRTPNQYVDADGIRTVRIRVTEERLPAEGRLEIVTGYGAETAYVPVSVVEPGAVAPEVEVDERLGEPPERRSSSAVTPDRALILGIAALGLFTAVIAVFLVQNVVVLTVVFVVVLAVTVAAGLLAI